MGFMDKAKKLAEQAQQKLDEAQEGFNQNAAPNAPGDAPAEVRYDEHGRPVSEPAPPAATPDPAAPDPAAQDAAAPEAGHDEDAPQPDPAAPAREPASDVDSTPDPFRPIGG